MYKKSKKHCNFIDTLERMEERMNSIGERINSLFSDHLEANDECDNSKDTNINGDIMDAEIFSERYVN